MEAQPVDKKEIAATRRRHERSLLQKRLQEEEAYEFANILENCGREMHLQCVACGHKSIAEVRCKKRWCPSCAYFVAVERVAKYRAAASRFTWPLFVTLTVPNSVDVEGLARIKTAWGKFRRRKLIRDRVKSGIVGFEITNKGNGWHPHIHALLDCRWLSIWTPEPNRSDNAEEKARKFAAAADELSRTWAECAGFDKCSVLARRADKMALVEVLKYSCKGSELIESPDPVAPLIELMQGMRLMTTFGEIRKWMADASAEEEETGGGCQCKQCQATGTTIPESAVQYLMRS
jgi:hypothetical protein